MILLLVYRKYRSYAAAATAAAQRNLFINDVNKILTMYNNQIDAFRCVTVDI